MMKTLYMAAAVLVAQAAGAHEPEQAHDLVPVEPTEMKEGVVAIDTLSSGSDAVMVVLYNDNTWRYVRDRELVRDDGVFSRYWSTHNLFPYGAAAQAEIPATVVIELVDSLKAYHFPYKAKVFSKYGPRRRRPHQGVDLSLKVGDPIYATFDGRVRISQYNTGGYGNLIIIRHDNGLETVYGHLSERIVEADNWVEAGQIIGYGGSTGRSSGPHLHFETRYYGQSFDPEWLIDFETGMLRRTTFLLRKSYFSIHAHAGQEFDDENGDEEKEEKKPAPTYVYHKIKSGDTLGAIARKYGTTVTAICRLNGIKSTTLLQLGRTLRVR